MGIRATEPKAGFGHQGYKTQGTTSVAVIKGTRAIEPKTCNAHQGYRTQGMTLAAVIKGRIG